MVRFGEALEEWVVDLGNQIGDVVVFGASDVAVVDDPPIDPPGTSLAAVEDAVELVESLVNVEELEDEAGLAVGILVVSATRCRKLQVYWASKDVADDDVPSAAVHEVVTLAAPPF